jgi:heparosan-N-sulfate-glucuronate 5-epimerase
MNVDTTHLRRSLSRTRDWLRAMRNPSVIGTRIPSDLDPNFPVVYYLEDHASEAGHAMDEEGVRVSRSAGNVHTYNPTVILNFGLAAYQKFMRTRDPYWRKRWLAQTDWIVRNQQLEGTFAGGWIFQLHLPDVGTTPGFVNASAQGKAICLLLRAWVHLRDEKYKSAAEAAVLPFTKSMYAGGVCIWYRNLYPFFETYPSDPPNFVLCGHMQAILGLWDLHVFSSNEIARRLARDGIRTLKGMLDAYDVGFWSKYSLTPGLPNVANIAYHRRAIDLLRLLNVITRDPVLHDYATRFEKYLQSKTCNLMAFIGKASWRLPRLRLRGFEPQEVRASTG